MRNNLRERRANRPTWDFEGVGANSLKELLEKVSSREGVSEVQFLEEKQVIIYKVGKKVFGGIVSEPESSRVCVCAQFRIFGDDIERSVDNAIKCYQKWWD